MELEEVRGLSKIFSAYITSITIYKMINKNLILEKCDLNPQRFENRPYFSSKYRTYHNRTISLAEALLLEAIKID